MSESPTVETVPTTSRWLLVGSAVALLVILIVNVPPFLRTPLDCDPILFDLYARDMLRGKVLYRDMVENNTPTMILLHMLVRSTLGHSPEALRIVDLAVVGLGLGFLARWFRPGRRDLHVFAFCLLTALYLTTTEWCHVQRDVWLLLPVIGALYLRRKQMLRLTANRGAFLGAVFEGIIWGLAVWMKPYALVMAAAVWALGMIWSRTRGASRKAILGDFAGLMLGGIVIGGAGLAVMHALGILVPYYDHITNWGMEYQNEDADAYVLRWFWRLSYLVRNAPWSLVYIFLIPVAAVLAVRSIRSRPPAGTDDRPDRVLLSTLLVSWGFQAWFLQHAFDYPHIAGEMFALVLAIDLAAGRPTPRLRARSLAMLAAITVVGHGIRFVERVTIWGECLRADVPPELYDRLSTYERMGWAELEGINQFLRSQNVRQGEFNVIGDSALPLWEMLDQTPPTRYYIVHNNLVSFQSHKEEMLKALSEVPNQRYLVCNLIEFHLDPEKEYDSSNPASWAPSKGWYGPRKWAEKIVFRSGRYAVVAMTAAEVPQWLDDIFYNEN